MYPECEPGNGRVTFTVPNLFETSLIITGAGAEDGWGFVHIEFLFRVPEEESKGFTGDDFRCLCWFTLTVFQSSLASLQPDSRREYPWLRMTSWRRALYQRMSLTLLSSAFSIYSVSITGRSMLHRMLTLQSAEMLSLTYQLEILLFQVIVPSSGPGIGTEAVHTGYADDDAWLEGLYGS